MTDGRDGLLQIEWIGGPWIFTSVMGPWPREHLRPVYVLVVGPFYVSIFPWVLAEGLWVE